MKKFKLFFLLSIAFYINLNAQEPSLNWMRSFGGTGEDVMYTLIIDDNDNSYGAGYFRSPSLIIDGVEYNNSSNSGTYEMFVVKYNKNGELVKCLTLGSSTSHDLLYDICFSTNNELLVVGFKKDYIYIAKLNSDLDIIWEKTILGNGIGGDEGRKIRSDKDGNIYMTGRFSSANLDFGNNVIINSYGGYSGFITKFNKDGEAIWAKSFGGSGVEFSYSLALDSNKNIYVCGRSTSTVINAGAFTSNKIGGDDIFVIKLDNDGNFKFLKTYGSSGFDEACDIRVDNNNNIYLVGEFSSTINFGINSLTSKGGLDGFLLKLDNIGNSLWAKQFGGIYDESIWGFSISNNDEIYLAGPFKSFFEFNSEKLQSLGSTDAFFLKYSIDGDELWSDIIGGVLEDRGYCSAINKNNLYLVGAFSNTINKEGNIITSNGGYDVFIAQYALKSNECNLTVNAGDNKTICSVASTTIKAEPNDTNVNYKWSTGATTQSINVSTTSNTKYYVTVQSKTNQECSVIDSIVITVNPLPSVDILSSKASNKCVWAESAGGTSYDKGQCITTDALGNTYVIGYFQGTANFGTNTLISAGGLDIFIAKYNTDGECIWAKSAGGTKYDYGSSITIDNLGNIYITGNFTDTANFGTHVITSNTGSVNAFIAKYNTDGECIWVKSNGGEKGNSITTDVLGNIYVTGDFYGTVIFGDDTLVNISSSSDVFITKYNSNGECLWAKSAGGNGVNHGRSITIDGLGNIYITGNFGGTITFGTHTLSSLGEVFVAKYDSNGECLWAKSAGGELDYGFSITTDNLGNVYVTGSFSGTATFGKYIINSLGGDDIFVAKYDSNGECIWVKQAGSYHNDHGYGIVSDGLGYIYFTGSFLGTATFGKYIINSLGGDDIFVAKYDSNGECIWVKQAGGKSSDVGYSITIDDLENIYITGEFDNSATFDNHSLSSFGGSDIFIAKYTIANVICKGESIMLTATGAESYVWNTGATSVAITVSPSINTTYSVTGTDQNGCTNTNNIVVKVNQLPSANAGTDKTINAGASTSLIATGGGTYSWSNGASTDTITVSPTLNTTYKLTVTKDGCTASDEVVVSVNNLNVSAGADKAICRGESTTLTATGADTYLWSTGATTAKITENPTITTTYTVTGTKDGGTASDSVVVTVNPLPTANAGSDKTIYKGASITLTATGGGTYSWSTGALTTTITVSPTFTTTYKLTVTKDDCTASDDVVVTVNILTINAGADKTICKGESTTLTATGSDTYLWSTGTSTETISVNPIATTTYIVTGTKSGATATDAVVVTVNLLPTANAGSDKTIYKGASTTLTATGGVSYTWSPGVYGQTISVSPTQTTTYKVSVYSAANCSASDDAIVYVNTLTVNAGEDKTICKGGSVTLTATGADSYSWSNTVLASTITVSPTSTSTYYVTGTKQGATASNAVIVIVNNLPIIDLGVDKTICNGTSVSLGVTGNYSFVWNTGSITQTISVSPTVNASYSLTVTDLNGCTATDKINVLLRTNPTFEINSQNVCMTNNANIILKSSNYLNNINISFGDNSNESANNVLLTEKTFSHLYTNAGNFIVNATVTDSFGCYTTKNKTLTVYSNPIADFSFNNACVNDEVQFLNNSTGAANNIWVINVDSITNNTINPKYTFSSAGDYQVKLYLTNSKGCKANIVKNITIHSKPIMEILTTNTCLNNASQIIIKNTNKATFNKILINYGNGDIDSILNFSGFQTNIDKKYNSPNIYNVGIAYTDNNNCSNTAVGNLQVYSLPTANAGSDQTVYSGAKTTLIATGGNSYIWSNNTYNAVNIVYPYSTSTYGLTVKDNNNCEATDAVVVYVETLAIDAGNNITICKGDTVILKTTGANTYSWSNGFNGPEISVLPNQTTTYRVTGYKDGGSAIDDVIVYVNSAMISTSGNQSICYGDSAVIYVSGGSTYTWDNGMGNDSITKVSPNVTKTYNVTTTNQYGCTNTSSILVSIVVIDAKMSSDVTIKLGSNITVSVITSGKYTYSWSNGQLSQSIIVSPTITTTYKVTISNGNCIKTDQVIVAVTDNITLVIEKIVTYGTSCFAGSDGRAIITVSGGVTPYSYHWSNGAPNNDTIYNLQKGTYSVTVYDFYGYHTSQSFSIQSLATEYFPQPVTKTEKITNNSATFKWSKIDWVNSYLLRYKENKSDAQWFYINLNSEDTSVQVNYLKNSTEYYWQIRAFKNQRVYSCFTDGITFTTADETKCANVKDLKSTINKQGFVTLSWDMDTMALRYIIGYRIKDSQNIYRYFYVDGSLNSANIYNLTANIDYEWIIRKFCKDNFYTDFSPKQYFSTLKTCEGPSNLNTINIATTNATLKWTNSTECVYNLIRWREEGSETWMYAKLNNKYDYINIGCIVCDDIHKLKPNTTYQWQIRTFCDDYELNYSDFSQIVTFITKDLAVNLGDNITICANSSTKITASANGSYIWNTGETTQSINVSPTENSTYSVTLTNNGYTSSDEIVVTIADKVIVDAGVDQTICSGTGTTCKAKGATNYEWNIGSMNDSICIEPLQTTTYIVTGIMNGCSGTDDVIVYVNPTPITNAGADIKICKGQIANIIATGGNVFSWDNNQTTAGLSVSPINTTSYTVTSFINDCSSSDMIVVVVSEVIADAGNDVSVCADQIVNLSATGGNQYSWSNGLKLPTVSVKPSVTTKYFVTVYNNDYCFGIDSVTVNVGSLAVDAGPDLTICNGDKVTITANATNATAFRWNIGSIKQTINMYPKTNTTYIVTVYSGTCIGTDNVVVAVTQCKNTETDKILKEIITNVNIYPNPSTDGVVNIAIENIEYPFNITITDAIGKTIQCNQIKEDFKNSSFNFQNVENGIYFIKIQNNTFSNTYKVIIRR